MYALMALNCAPPESLWLGDAASIIEFANSVKWEYTDELMDPVQQCVQFRPGDRPTFPDIVQRIEQCIVENGTYLAQGMRIPATADPFLRQYDNQLVHHQPADQYAIGLAQNLLPAKWESWSEAQLSPVTHHLPCWDGQTTSSGFIEGEQALTKLSV